MKYKKIECDEAITEGNLTDKSRSIRFGGIQKGFSNLTGYIVALDDTHRIVEDWSPAVRAKTRKHSCVTTFCSMSGSQINMAAYAAFLIRDMSPIRSVISKMSGPMEWRRHFSLKLSDSMLKIFSCHP